MKYKLRSQITALKGTITSELEWFPNTHLCISNWRWTAKNFFPWLVESDLRLLSRTLALTPRYKIINICRSIFSLYCHWFSSQVSRRFSTDIFNIMNLITVVTGSFPGTGVTFCWLNTGFVQVFKNKIPDHFQTFSRPLHQFSRLKIRSFFQTTILQTDDVSIACVACSSFANYMRDNWYSADTFLI